MIRNRTGGRLQSLFGRRLQRFVLVGILNTLVGYACILILQAITHNPVMSNLLGYGLSASFSYLSHSRLTFRAKPSRRSVGAYTVVLIVSYLLNVAVLKLALIWLAPVIAQGLAVLSFAILSYLGQVFFVFPQKSSGGASEKTLQG